MRPFILFLLLFFTVAFPVQADFYLAIDSQLSAIYEEENVFSPEFAIESGCDLYYFVSESLSLFLESQGELAFITNTQKLAGELDVAADISFRLENILIRGGFSSQFEGQMDDDTYFDIIPEIYISYGELVFTLFTAHKVFIMPLQEEIYAYQGQIGIAVAQDNILHKPSLGLGVDFTDLDYPFYLIVKYDLDWYLGTFILLTGYTDFNYYFKEVQYWEWLWKIDLVWTVSSGANLTFEFAGEYSTYLSDIETGIQPKVELDVDLSESSFLTFSAGGDIFINRSISNDPSYLFGSIKLTYLF